MLENDRNSKSYRITTLSFSVILVMVLTIALIPSWREKAQNFFWKSDRLVLAKAQASLGLDHPSVTIYKIKTKENLLLEIYKNNGADGSTDLLSHFILEGNQDGFMNFQSQASNLFVTDVDEDGFLDIVAPTFDDQQQARMNVFRYDSSSQNFVKFENE